MWNKIFPIVLSQPLPVLLTVIKVGMFTNKEAMKSKKKKWSHYKRDDQR